MAMHGDRLEVLCHLSILAIEFLITEFQALEGDRFPNLMCFI